MQKLEAGSIGIFGGSFNPPHVGHVLACHYALMRWKLAKVLVIPSFQHPFGKELPAYEHRRRMCELAFGNLGDSIEICDIEKDRAGMSYTVDTVRELISMNSGAHYRLLVGGDILPDVPKWREAEELERLAPKLVIPRLADGKVLGGGALDGALPDISSTQLREAMGRGDYPAALPAAVADYIRAQRLYL